MRFFAFCSTKGAQKRGERKVCFVFRTYHAQRRASFREKKREREGLFVDFILLLSAFSFFLSFLLSHPFLFRVLRRKKNKKCVALFPTTSARRGVRVFRRLSSRRADRRERRVIFFFEGSAISGSDARPSCLCSSASCISSITPSRDW